MKHATSPDFWDCYYDLPADVQRLADTAFAHLKENPRHPAVRLKKAGRYWSARIGKHYRAVAIEGADGFVWFWIGPHAEYDGILKSR